MTGLSFGPVDALDDLTLDPGEAGGRRGEALVSIGGRHFFAAVRRGQCDMYVIGCKAIADMDEAVPPRETMSAFFAQLVPAMMFLKHAFKEAAWHAPVSYANLTVDDPLLQERYGFLSYRKLLETMDRCNFFTTIAFIPWNYRRSDRRTAALLRSRPDRFSLAIHGCDHTGGEFSSDDLPLLRLDDQDSIRQDAAAPRDNGLEFDPVMVFPQGLFSCAAGHAGVEGEQFRSGS